MTLAQDTDQREEEEAREALVRHGTELEDFLAEVPGRREGLVEIIRNCLDRSDPVGWQIISSSVNAYVGLPDIARFLLWHFASPERVVEVESYAPRGAASFLREIAALYGTDLESAYLADTELPNDWRRGQREIHLDVLTNKLVFQVNLEKYSGEVVFLEAHAPSLLTLTTRFLDMLRYAGPGVYDEGIIRTFLSVSIPYLYSFMRAERESPEKPFLEIVEGSPDEDALSFVEAMFGLGQSLTAILSRPQVARKASKELVETYLAASRSSLTSLRGAMKEERVEPGHHA